MLSLEIIEKAPEGFYTSIWDVTSLLFVCQFRLISLVLGKNLLNLLKFC